MTYNKNLYFIEYFDDTTIYVVARSMEKALQISADDFREIRSITRMSRDVLIDYVFINKPQEDR